MSVLHAIFRHRNWLLMPTMTIFTIFNLARHLPETPQMTKHPQKEYDYIIVGAGSAGSALAYRLSEDPNNSVLLIEAGGLESGASDIPAYAAFADVQTWFFSSQPQQPKMKGYIEKGPPIINGKVLGGGSTVNFLMFMRGNRGDYDSWDEIAGGTGMWKWDKVFPYFIRMEDQQSPELMNNGYHSTGGLKSLEIARFLSPLGQTVLDMAKENNIPIGDYNQGDDQGKFGRMQFSTKQGVRQSSAKAYLRNDEVLKRKNLDIMINSVVTKLTIDSDKSVTGVEIERERKILKDKTFFVKARKETIVSAGGIFTPAILMRSGIGDCDHLKEVGIDCKHNLPAVGSNFQDHVSPTGLNFLINDEMDPLQNVDILNEKFVAEYKANGSGPLSLPFSLDVNGFIDSFADYPLKEGEKMSQTPDVQVVKILGNAVISNTFLGDGRREAIAKYYKPHVGKSSFAMFPILIRPKSRGVIRLKSSDPHENPLVNPKYLTNDDDIERLVNVSKKITKMVMSSKAFQVHNIEEFPEPYPGCEDHNRNSDEYFRCMTYMSSIGFVHYTGSCSLGHCVDEHLRVKGMKKLRVADISVIPIEPSGNTMAPGIMIGEKAADIILGEKWFKEFGHQIQPGRVRA